MIGPQRPTSLWAGSSPSRTPSTESYSTNNSTTMTGSTGASSVDGTMEDVGQQPPRRNIGPRRGGNTKEAWMCCVCKYHNKTASTVCSNLDSDRCARRLSQDELESRSKSKRWLNHRRCEACFPSEYGVYGNGGSRRWPQALDHIAQDMLEEEAGIQLSVADKEEFENVIADRKSKPARRDALTCQRIGEWPQ